MDDSGILPLACIPAIHGGHAEDERHMDVLERPRKNDPSLPEHVTPDFPNAPILCCLAIKVH